MHDDEGASPEEWNQIIRGGLEPAPDQEGERRRHRELQDSIDERLEANERARKRPGVIG